MWKLCNLLETYSTPSILDLAAEAPETSGKFAGRSLEYLHALNKSSGTRSIHVYTILDMKRSYVLFYATRVLDELE
jgi:hypothetical protein